MLTWISDSDLNREIESLTSRAFEALIKAERRRTSNVVDPFASILLAKMLDIDSIGDLVQAQQVESATRGMSGAIGDFHQQVLGCVDGWRNHDAGYDLECESRRLLAELKNKWNTMNAGARHGVESDLRTAVRQHSGHWTAYLVLIIPKKPERYEREISPNVIETDGASFYHTATGDPNSLHDLLNIVCDRIAPSGEIFEHCRTIGAQSLPPRI